jgi:adenine/guanine phosphoribosyltransferase-like PRPP-binding protein
VVVVDSPGVAAAVAACWSTAVVHDRQGKPGRGFLNLKRLLGHPPEFRLVIQELARSVPPGVAVAACDEGAWPLVGALIIELGTPAVLIRREPKEYFVAYGGDPALGHPRLAGERLDPGTSVHLVDDLLYSGATLNSAASVLTSAGLRVREASVIVGADRADRVAMMVRSTSLERITCLVLAPDLDLRI